MTSITTTHRCAKHTQPYAFVKIIFIGILICLSSFNSIADEFDDDEDDVIKVHLKKIRDAEGNYLINATKAAARSISKGGEFKVGKYSKNKYKSGPIVGVSPPIFNFTPYKDGMSASDMANVGLETLASLGDLFGSSEKADKLRETNAKLQDPDGFLEKMSDDQELLVSMTSEVELYDEQRDIEVFRAIKFEKVFPNKIEFAKQKEQMIEDEVVSAVKLALIEYMDEL
ncbi:hypothetical protein [Neptunicella sp. SCSIO 80796]|uniref:hypothetical protein n=1 Tax=Neptunicella plasticusilytica TaxID=3117012 RepID=UPI003A4D7D56